ncbi:uncharacterized protein MYCFIDRAFT_81828 [Pseudocercospora fijiensis CIRAD86]|uniref:Protein kinase domain-containing protein n=1 Tax=Pseudocercospora fijiensis (strain CIRAD86) TaxID=383855 RepID=M3AFD0_PSEFD|nr:uncharacterized protein MYCFIDRAFT_81828 [Pseudocercospora fijiensis CIRAD86]EME83286.1 hypothetical protein MYCFIDRAFT_81828 [Pseudocercospora fijiensis CIRAD86]
MALLHRYTKDNSMVPEPFLWRLLESMAYACLAMQQGATDAAVDGWRQIIHRDLKSDNVFLASENGSHYPQPKIADFEFAYETTADDPFNPIMWRAQGVGCLNCQAPETHGAVSEDLENSKVLSPANVWCIGITLWHLMNDGMYKVEVNQQWEEDDYVMRNPWGENPENYYSQPLLTAVTNCLTYSPEWRVTPQGILDFIESSAGDDQAGPCIAARNAVSENDAGFNQQQWAYRGVQDPVTRAWADVLGDREQFEQQQAAAREAAQAAAAAVESELDSASSEGEGEQPPPPPPGYFGGGPPMPALRPMTAEDMLPSSEGDGESD